MTAAETEQLRADIVRTAHLLASRGLTPGSSGNISAKLRDGNVLITPTNARLGELEVHDIALLAPDGTRLAGGYPSKEAFLHLAVYRARPSAGAIIHLHATHAAAVSCMDGLDASDCLPPLTAYYVMKVGRLPLAGYRPPGDLALAEDIARLAADHPVMLLANHGPLASGETLAAASNAIEELEETAKIFLLLRGSPSRPLDASQISELESLFGAASQSKEHGR